MNNPPRWTGPEKKWRLGLAIGQLLAALALWSASAIAETAALAEADAVLAQATSLDDFLSKPELIEKYYTAIRKLYGDGVERAAFNNILTQLTAHKETVPALKEALWKHAISKP